MHQYHWDRNYKYPEKGEKIYIVPIPMKEAGTTINDRSLPFVSDESISLFHVQSNYSSRSLSTVQSQEDKERLSLNETLSLSALESRLLQLKHEFSDLNLHTSGSIKASCKSFKLNDPQAFGKTLEEDRDVVEATPLLPAVVVTNSVVKGVVSDEEDEIMKLPRELPTEDNVETKKNQQICSRGHTEHHQHFTGDGCVLHDPAQRAKQLLAFQEYMKQSEAIRKLANSPKTFVSQACSAIIPNTSVAFDPMDSEDEAERRAEPHAVLEIIKQPMKNEVEMAKETIEEQSKRHQRFNLVRYFKRKVKK